jgi:sodium/proline symporter
MLCIQTAKETLFEGKTAQGWKESYDAAAENHKKELDALRFQSLLDSAIASSKGKGAQAIMDLVENAWAGFGSSFGAVIILSLFWRRFTYKGALAGVIAGAVTDVLWLIFLTAPTGVYEIIPGFIASLLAAVAATLLDKEPSEEVTAIFDAATAPIEE